MSAVLLVIMVSGTLPLVMQMSLLVNKWVKATSLMQWYQSYLGDLVMIIRLNMPRFSLWMQLSVAFCHGE
jgi:hypothetical protein